ncbi:MAG: methyltransferase domain-containing protein [Candidatus Aminicenantes bacterium]|jgi:SAM-dependent methyltransferase
MISNIRPKYRILLLAVCVWALIPVVGWGTSNQETLDTTIRNSTKETIRYSVRPHRSEQEREEKILEVGAVHSYPGSIAVDITFQRGEKRITYRVDPGKAYSFRYDEKGLLELFLGSHGRPDAADLAPFLVTPEIVVERMLQLAEVNENDVVYDIGCGDGRIVILAAKKFGARGVGIDIIPKRIEESRKNARIAGVEHLVEFRLEDATESDISGATVVTMYLVPDSNELMRPKLEKQLKPGTRVVSHGYPILGWEEKLIHFFEVETEFEAVHLIYVYRI